MNAGAEHLEADRLADKVDDSAAKVIRAAEVTWGAREALNGCFAGIELDNRIRAWVACCEAEHRAVSDLKAARAALSAAQDQEDDGHAG
jgi:hypothetical protein